MTALTVELFAGIRGWSHGLAMIADTPSVGFELDRWACASATAAGHRSVRADAETWPVDHMTIDGLTASPPCQMFSVAGKGEGRALLPELVDAAAQGRLRPDLPVKVRLVLEPVRWIDALRPRWVAMEQVPAVLPVWEASAHWMRTLGYSAWAGVLNSADYGVPQTRQRAILIASLDRTVTCPPPANSEHPTLLGTAAWVSMEAAIGWGPADRPARTVCGNRQPRWLYENRDGTHGRVVLDRRTNSKAAGGGMAPTVPVPVGRPAPTLTAQGLGGQAVWRIIGGDADGAQRAIEPAEALVLQSFPPDLPLIGNRTEQGRQIGNAVPPLLAGHVLAEALGVAPPHLVETAGEAVR